MLESVKSAARWFVAGVDASVFTNASGSSAQQTQRAKGVDGNDTARGSERGADAKTASSGAHNHRRTTPAEERLSMLTGAGIRVTKGARECSKARKARDTHGRSRARQGGAGRAAAPLRRTKKIVLKTMKPPIRSGKAPKRRGITGPAALHHHPLKVWRTISRRAPRRCAGLPRARPYQRATSTISCVPDVGWLVIDCSRPRPTTGGPAGTGLPLLRKWGCLHRSTTTSSASENSRS